MEPKRVMEPKRCPHGFRYDLRGPGALWTFVYMILLFGATIAGILFGIEIGEHR